MMNIDELHEKLEELAYLKRNAEEHQEISYYKEQIEHIKRLQKAYLKELRKAEKR